MSLQVLCILNAACFGNVSPSSGRVEQVLQKIVSVGTAYICILYALSTWFYHSNYYEPRQHIRIVVSILHIPCTTNIQIYPTQFLIMLFIIIVANLTVFVMLVVEAIAWSMSDVINTEGMFSTYVGVCNVISIVLVFITIVLLLAVFLYLLTLAIKKQKEHSGRHSSE